MWFPTLLALTLCVGLDASDAAESPDAVKNLRVYQEGFDGLISLRWESPPSFGDASVLADITAFHDNEAIANTTGEHGGLGALTIKNPTVGETYIFEIVPYTDGKKVVGQPTRISFSFQGRDTKISSPTDFKYEFLPNMPGAWLFHWQWEDNSAFFDSKNTWFFVEYCRRPIPDGIYDCNHLISLNKTTLAVMLNESIYDVKIFAHIGGSQDGHPVKTSEPLAYTLRTFPGLRPIPELPKLDPVLDLATKDTVPYVLSWYLFPRDNVINVTVEVHAAAGEVEMTLGTDGYGENVTIVLKYNTYYYFESFVYYNESNVPYKQRGFPESVTTIHGPSHPVTNLEASQSWSGDRVTLEWEPPRITNGPLQRYDIQVTNQNGTEVQPREKVTIDKSTTPFDKSLKSATITIKNVKFGPVYKFAVIPVGSNDADGSDLFGQPADVSIVLKSRLPVWAIALIVVAVLAVVAGGFYYVKRRR